MKGKLTISIEIPEKDFIEYLLNAKYSNGSQESIFFFLSIYAIGKEWSFDKLIYYKNLLELKKEKL